MATTAQTKAGRRVGGFLLIHFHHPVARSVTRLRRVELAKGWPGGASVIRVQRIRRIVAPKRARKFHAFAELQAADRPALRRVLDYLEENFSHIEAYEFFEGGG